MNENEHDRQLRKFKADMAKANEKLDNITDEIDAENRALIKKLPEAVQKKIAELEAIVRKHEADIDLYNTKSDEAQDKADAVRQEIGDIIQKELGQ